MPQSDDITSQAKPRILAIFGNVAFMGQERANLQVFRILSERGNYDVHLAVNDRGVQWHVLPHVEAAGLPYSRMRFAWNLRKTLNPRFWIYFLVDVAKSNWQFLCLHRRLKPDVLHCGNAGHLMYLLPVLFLVRSPLVMRLGDAPERFRWLYRFLWRLLARRVDHFVCNAQFIRNRLQEIRDVSDKVTLIRNLPVARPLADNTISAADQASIFTVVYIGQIAAIKGVDIAVAAMKRFLTHHPDGVLLLAGTLSHNPWGTNLADSAKCSHVLDRIQFLGHIEHVPELLSKAHVHLCPSVYDEASPNVVFEAKQAGIPSIVFHSGGLPELIRDGVDGTVCREKTVACLVEALEEYYRMPDWGRTRGQSAKESLTRLGVTDERFVASWLNVYQNVLAKKR